MYSALVFYGHHLATCCPNARNVRGSDGAKKRRISSDMGGGAGFEKPVGFSGCCREADHNVIGKLVHFFVKGVKALLSLGWWRVEFVIAIILVLLLDFGKMSMLRL